MRTLLNCLLLAVAVLPAQAQAVDICDRTPEVRDAILEALEVDDCAAVESVGLASVGILDLGKKQLTALRSGDFDGLTSLQRLGLSENDLTRLPAGVFDGLTSLQELDFSRNRLRTLPAGVFDGLTSLERLRLYENQLTTLPGGVFDGLTRLQYLYLFGNRLTAFPDGVFDDLTGLEFLWLSEIDLTTLPDGVFDGLTSLLFLWLMESDLTTLPDGVFDSLPSLQQLDLRGNRLTALPDGAFDGLTSLQFLGLNENNLRTLPDGVFDGLISLQELNLSRNRLTTLPEGVFDGLISLLSLDLRNNHLVGLTRDDPLFSDLRSDANIRLGGQTTPPAQPKPTRIVAAVPLMLSTADSTRQGFVRIINITLDSGSVRIFAFDDSGYAPDPIDVPLDAQSVVHFNSNDLENGNAIKGIEGGVGRPVQGDWRLDIETTLSVRVLAFVRTGDGFLTAMHDVLPRDAYGRLRAHTFNPGGNMNQESRLRLANTGANEESVLVEGIDDRGSGGSGWLTLPAGETRTLSAFDLENHPLGDGTGKWQLFITAGPSVVGMSLLESVTGHLTNISTAGVAQ